MELITTGLGAGTYPDEPKERFPFEEERRESAYKTALHMAAKYPQFMQEFSDQQPFRASYEGEYWDSLSCEHQQKIIRQALKMILSESEDLFERSQYLRRNCFAYREFLESQKGV